jgi:hypothetical protein
MGGPLHGVKVLELGSRFVLKTGIPWEYLPASWAIGALLRQRGGLRPRMGGGAVR